MNKTAKDKIILFALIMVIVFLFGCASVYRPDCAGVLDVIAQQPGTCATKSIRAMRVLEAEGETARICWGFNGTQQDYEGHVNIEIYSNGQWYRWEPDEWPDYDNWWEIKCYPNQGFGYWYRSVSLYELEQKQPDEYGKYSPQEIINRLPIGRANYGNI